MEARRVAAFHNVRMARQRWLQVSNQINSIGAGRAVNVRRRVSIQTAAKV